MDSDQSVTPAAGPDCVVQLTEHSDGWYISVITGRAAGVFHSDHREKQTAVATAVAVAVAAGGGLLILTRRDGVAFLLTDRLAAYELPPRG
jgi:hypothetical protein